MFNNFQWQYLRNCIQWKSYAFFGEWQKLHLVLKRQRHKKSMKSIGGVAKGWTMNRQPFCSLFCLSAYWLAHWQKKTVENLNFNEFSIFIDGGGVNVINDWNINNIYLSLHPSTNIHWHFTLRMSRSAGTMRLNGLKITQ